MKLYHVTTAEAARSIMREGFRDSAGYYMTDIWLEGIWLSDQMLDVNEGAEGDTVLAVTLSAPLATLADYELIEEGKGYREWCVPARIINAVGRVRVLEPDPRLAD